MKTSQIKIIGGNLKGSKLFFRSSSHLRPTANKLRETLFNWLQFDIKGMNCLDSFAGTGALGIEAISRGAKHVTFLEKTPQAVKDLKKNIDRLALEKLSNVEMTNAFQWIQNNSLLDFDLLMLDPPFYDQRIEKFMKNLVLKELKKDGLVYFEKSTFDKLYIPNEFEVLKSKKIGDAEGILMRYET